MVVFICVQLLCTVPEGIGMPLVSRSSGGAGDDDDDRWTGM
jgi:hypothetical protein